ncbi:hypothetical protein BHAOGJBA_0693 [Methylobacterium hispanicum]|uniref:HIRAN domain-containing protein n=1 Tax=Methylobacterium hispanicum TaxID=270350 RepID=A0AAV4ZG60_9HYPH|nr:HIRAN domain-containing protein [Methylobacterium hispanicum]GJD87193.1 hypothetical protein BHAOGJBA_0693 [Methylobacterium hispanicum]
MAEIPAVALIENSDAAEEADRLRNGEPWHMSSVAGLQVYDYGTEGLDEQPVRPREGDRLHLIRAPENPYDENAIEVWWKNSIRLGRVPRDLAAQLAWRLDEGQVLRAYVANGGDGSAWSARALFVGEAVRHIYERRRDREIANGVDAHWYAERCDEERRRRVGQDHGRQFELRIHAVREARMAQAVAVFRRAITADMTEVEARMPAAGEKHELIMLESAVGCSRSTGKRLAARAGAPVRVARPGCYSDGSYVNVTPALRTALAEWAARHN